MPLHKYTYVILGGGVVAGYAAQEFVEQGLEPGALAIVSAETTLPYDRPPLSKGYLAGEKDTADILINDPDFYTQHGIQVHLDTRVTRVDVPGKRLYAGPDTTIEFDKLLIATGSRLRKLDLPGADLTGLHYLRSRAQSDAIAAAMQSAEQAVIIGGGYIGMEVASVLAGAGLKVSMVFPETRLLERFFTPEMSAFFQGYFSARGVTFLPETLPVAFTGEQGRITHVKLDDGQTLPADFVVAGIGVEPNIELFEPTGLVLDNGVVVNKYLETNRGGVFAAGDAANYYDVIFQKRRRIEHWDNAVQQGRHAARMMLRTSRKQPEAFMALRYFFSDVFDLSYEFWGDTEGADQVVHRGDVNGGSFSVWWLSGPRVEAAFVMNRPDEERELAPEWIQTRRVIQADKLRDASLPLKSLTRF